MFVIAESPLKRCQSIFDSLWMFSGVNALYKQRCDLCEWTGIAHDMNEVCGVFGLLSLVECDGF